MVPGARLFNVRAPGLDYLIHSGPWAEPMGRAHGRGPWAGPMGKAHGQGPWAGPFGPLLPAGEQISSSKFVI